MAQRLGITSARVLRQVHLIADGVGPLVVPKNASFVDAAWQRAAMRRRAVHHERSAAPKAADALVSKGCRWGVDLTCRMPLSVDGKRYGVVFVEFRTGYMLVYYLVDKTTDSFVYALRELTGWVHARFGPGPPL